MKKNYFSKIKLLIFCLSYVACISSVNAVDRETKIKKLGQNITQYCFVQSAGKAKIELNKKEKDSFIITLERVIPYVTYFSERPQRKVGSMPMQDFIKLWERNDEDSFKKDPPNADLSGVYGEFASSEDNVFNLIVELKDPRFDPKTKSLTYTAKPLQGRGGSLLKPMTLHHITLFIDDVCIECWG